MDDNSGESFRLWEVGASTTKTTEYVCENEAPLGGSSVGWWRVLIGKSLGGPIGAIVGGLVATAVTGQTLTSVDELQMKKTIAIEANHRSQTSFL